MARDLLPPNASPHERALSEGLARLSDVPVPVDTLNSPESCPVALLPWLAWALSVDEWDEGWTEGQKRAVVAASVEIHRRKGTRGAVERAIKALGYDARVLEWWEEAPEGERGTFRISINVDDRGVDSALYDSLKRTVFAAKNTRSHLAGFDVAVTGRGICPQVAGIAQTGEVLTVYPWRSQNPTVAAQIRYATAAVTYSTITVQG